MSDTITQDSLQSADVGYRYGQAETVTVAAGVLVSSTQNIGVFSDYTNSRLINNGHIISIGSDDLGVGVQFDRNESSIVNAAGASIAGTEAGLRLTGNRLALTNHGTIQGLHGGDGENLGYGILCYAPPTADTANVAILNGVDGVISGGAAAIVLVAITGGSILIDNRGLIDGQISIAYSDANSVVLNRGTVTGAVILGDGNDVFKGAGGRSGPVYGADGRDTLAGGRLADRLDGGPGADILTGRGGADHFIFDTELNPATNTDTITDFTVNLDRIVLGEADDRFAGVGPAGILGAARFHVGPAAADASDRIIYNPNTGALFYDHDGRGGDPQLRFAVLAKHLALDHADFAVFLLQ